MAEEEKEEEEEEVDDNDNDDDNVNDDVVGDKEMLGGDSCTLVKLSLLAVFSTVLPDSSLTLSFSNASLSSLTRWSLSFCALATDSQRISAVRCY